MILLSFSFFLDISPFHYNRKQGYQGIGHEQAWLCCNLTIEWINCNGRCLPCHWCKIEEEIIEKRSETKKREKDREGEKKNGLFI